MARWGAKLALIDIHEGRLNEVLAKCAEIGLPSENIYSVVGDVMKEEVVTSFVEGAVQAFGTVNFLVNIYEFIYFNSPTVGASSVDLIYKYRKHIDRIHFVHCGNGIFCFDIYSRISRWIAYWLK